jgi:molybdenum-dependent DNA-binding transcriptional regulator ModE
MTAWPKPCCQIVCAEGTRLAGTRGAEMDDFGKMKTLIEVVDAGSFSRAARSMSVSAETRRVQSLEDELGGRLLNRNTRGLSLTDAVATSITA